MITHSFSAAAKVATKRGLARGFAVVPESSPSVECSFCSRTRAEVGDMVSKGPLAICDECAEHAQSAVDTDAPPDTQPAPVTDQPLPVSASDLFDSPA